jgi:hypothetical protein
MLRSGCVAAIACEVLLHVARAAGLFAGRAASRKRRLRMFAGPAFASSGPDFCHNHCRKTEFEWRLAPLGGHAALFRSQVGIVANDGCTS